jgi:HEAT repeat protein
MTFGAQAAPQPAAQQTPVSPSAFVRVDGAGLNSKLDAAARLARGNNQAARYWTAYQFDVRPGVAIDMEWRKENGKSVPVGGTRVGSQYETRNLGVFLLREAGGDGFTRVEVYNLDRPHDYGGYPVYWLGRAGSDESLTLLKGLAESETSAKVAEHAVTAIALHDDARAASMLEEFVRRSQNEHLRKQAVFWLGQVDGAHPLLAELVRNEEEKPEVRKQAAFAIGVSKNPAALAALESLYAEVKAREVRKQIIFAASINGNHDEGRANSEAGVDFLIRVAGSEPDRGLKKQALFWLGQKAGERSRAALGDVIESNDADTEVQKQAVFALSQRPKDEAVPMLIKIARTHAKPEVRKQALFWLGQTGDERALAFFKEVLAK